MFTGRNACDNDFHNLKTFDKFPVCSFLGDIGEIRKSHMYVAKNIYTFNKKDPSRIKNRIITCKSNVGPNGVPNVFAYGERNVYYILFQKYVLYSLHEEKR